MKRIVVAALIVAAMVGGLMCGGTTGHEGLPNLATGTDATSEATTGLEAAVDSGLGSDSTVSSASLDASSPIDVVIMYADRALPDVHVPPEGGAGGSLEAGPVFPNCAPDIALLNGQPTTDLTNCIDMAPAVYDDSGAAVLAPDGSACATYPWLGSLAVDECLTSQDACQQPFALLPPCNWVADAGFATLGSGAGRPRYDLCVDLYECVVNTGCAQHNATDCLCGPGSSSSTAACSMDASGPCATEELAALESLGDPGSITQDLKTFTEFGAKTGIGAKLLNNILSAAATHGCYKLLDAGSD